MRAANRGPNQLARLGRRGALVFAVLCFLAAALSQGAPSPVSAPTAPGAPEWVGELRNARDVTGKGSWFKRLAKKVIGIDDREKALLMPYGIHVDAQGRILVADTRARLVHLFDAARHRYQVIRPPASDPMLAPIAVDSDASGHIYVSDSVRSRIFVFSPEGRFLRTLGGLDKEESIFKRCTGLAIDRQRARLYVVDTTAMRVVVLDLDGRVLARIGQRGIGPGEFNFPTQIAMAPDGSFWVVDSLNFRVQHFSPDGKFLSAFGQLGERAGEFDKAKGITIDRLGRLYVVEGLNDRVQAYDPEGRLLFVFGSTGNGPGQFYLPTGIATDGERILVSDSYNNRVEIFRLSPAGAAPAGGN
jgi:sugar lactone lactonase YvrE